MSPQFIKYLKVILLCFCSQQALGQVDDNNLIYSFFGLGELNDNTTVQTSGMGEAGFANSGLLYSNIQNPAALNHFQLTIFEIEYQISRRELKSKEGQQRILDGNISYLTLIVPLSKFWKSGLGLRPYSQVEYKTNFIEHIEGTGQFVQYSYTGSGGISDFFWMHSFKVKPNISLGLDLNFYFGNIERSESSQLINFGTGDKIKNSREQRYRAFSVFPSFLWQIPIKEKLKLNLAATYQYSFKFNLQQNIAKQFVDPSGLFTDSEIIQTSENQINVPALYKFGATLEQINKLIIAADVVYQDWQNFTFEANNQSFQTRLAASLGLEYYPDILSATNYLKRIAYRTGIRYVHLPYVINNQNIEEVNVSLGFSLPIGKFSKLNLAFVAGQRGTEDHNLVADRFLQFHFGITINSQWFVKKRFD